MTTNAEVLAYLGQILDHKDCDKGELLNWLWQFRNNMKIVEENEWGFNAAEMAGFEAHQRGEPLGKLKAIKANRYRKAQLLVDVVGRAKVMYEVKGWKWSIN